MSSPSYDLAKIRDLLINGFDDRELRALCLDVPDFRAVYDRLARNTGKAEIVAELIEYAHRQHKIDTLLTWAQERNPARYELHGPYLVDTPASPAPKKASTLVDRVRDISASVSRRLKGPRSPGCIVRGILVVFAVSLVLVLLAFVLWQQVIGRMYVLGNYADGWGDLGGACLWRVNLSGTDLRGISLYEADLRGADLRGIFLTDAQLERANLRAANLTEAKLMGSYLDEADLSHANLHLADLRGAHLKEAILTHANLRGTVVNDATEMDEKWRRVWAILNGKAHEVLPQSGDGSYTMDLSGADLEGVNLEQAYFGAVTLSDANLKDANLQGANLGGAVMYGTNLSGADLQGANLRGAKLGGALLRGANLSGADLQGAEVTEAQLSQAASLQGARMPDGTLHE